MKQDYDPLHWSLLSEMRVSPAQFLYRTQTPKVATKAMKIGHLAHEFVFGKGPYYEPWIVFDGERRGKKWTEFKDEHEGKDIFTVAEKNLAQSIACTALDAWPEELKGGEQEKTLRFKIREREFEGTPDVGSELALVDMKVTAYAHPAKIERHVRAMGWHAQMALYREALRQNGTDVRSVMLVCVEPTPPHNAGVYILSEGTLDAGTMLYLDLLDQLEQCEFKQDFLSYNGGEPVVLDIQEYSSFALDVDGEEIRYDA